MDDNHRMRTVAFIAIIAVLAIVIVITTIQAVNKGKRKHNKEQNEEQEQTELADDDNGEPVDTDGFSSSTVILKAINEDDGMMTFFDIESGEEFTLSYNGATDIRNRYDKIISASVLNAGYFADITFAPDEMILKSLKGSNEAWEHKGIMNLLIDDSYKKFTVSGTIYRYDDKLQVLSDDRFISLADIGPDDVFSIYGIGDFAYLLKVDKGHGYLELAAAEDFIGGVLTIGRNRNEIITEDLHITLSEGIYQVRAENEEFYGEAEIKITRDTVSRFDLSPYGLSAIERGEVSFAITPAFAELYIDGVKTDYSSSVMLRYGDHQIEVVLGGYNSYKGFFEVNAEKKSLHITLSEAPDTPEDPDEIAEDYDYESEEDGEDEESIPDSTSDSEDEETDIPDSSSEEEEEEEEDTDEETGTKLDEGHTLTIACSDGAKVYLDGEYEGVIENGKLVLPKRVGEIVVRLEREGYVSRNYTIEIESGDENVEFSFPDLIKDN